MAATETLQIPLGYKAPGFSLPDTVSGKTLSLDDVIGAKATVVMFICNHCPYVLHVKEELSRLAIDYKASGVAFVAISSNNIEKYPADSPEHMTTFAKTNGFIFPYLYDESQDVARAYFAACTPDFSIFNADLRCIYRGQLDDSRPSNGKPVTGKDLRAALDSLLEGRPVNPLQIPSLGCNIKWKDA